MNHQYSKITALYSRLSVGDEDRDGGESNSIQNQKIFLERYAKQQKLTNLKHYIDDDESGRFFDRSAYVQMMDDVENGKADILERPEYQGHTVNFKTYKQSYKSKKTCYNPKEKQLVFENTHEAIIDADTWERVQELRKNKRRPTRTGKTNLFSGIVRCADCGEKLYYCTSKNFEARQDHFVCSTSRLKGKEVCPTHFIRAVV